MFYGDATVFPRRYPGVSPMRSDPHGRHTGVSPGYRRSVRRAPGWYGGPLDGGSGWRRAYSGTAGRGSFPSPKKYEKKL